MPGSRDLEGFVQVGDGLVEEIIFAPELLLL